MLLFVITSWDFTTYVMVLLKSYTYYLPTVYLAIALSRFVHTVTNCKPRPVICVIFLTNLTQGECDLSTFAYLYVFTAGDPSPPSTLIQVTYLYLT